MAGNFGAPLPVFLPHHQLWVDRKCSRTYLAMIACVLQDAPEQMLSFCQLMERLQGVVTGDRKTFENKVRVCLSTSKCFVKIPQMSSCKINYWKLDHSQITAKMVRRHFKGILSRFPELRPKVATDPPRSPGLLTALCSPEPAACKVTPAGCRLKFSSPFSIESLLRTDGPSVRGYKPPRPDMSFQAARVEQQTEFTEGLFAPHSRLGWEQLPVKSHLHSWDKRWPFHSTWRNSEPGLGEPEARPFKRMCADPSVIIQPRNGTAPYISCTQSNYVNYTVSTFVGDVHHFRL